MHNWHHTHLTDKWVLNPAYMILAASTEIINIYNYNMQPLLCTQKYSEYWWKCRQHYTRHSKLNLFHTCSLPPNHLGFSRFWTQPLILAASIATIMQPLLCTKPVCVCVCAYVHACPCVHLCACLNGWTTNHASCSSDLRCHHQHPVPHSQGSPVGCLPPRLFQWTSTLDQNWIPENMYITNGYKPNYSWIPSHNLTRCSISRILTQPECVIVLKLNMFSTHPHSELIHAVNSFCTQSRGWFNGTPWDPVICQRPRFIH